MQELLLAFLRSLALAVFYVASLYVWWIVCARNTLFGEEPDQIVRRFISVGVASVVSIAYVHGLLGIDLSFIGLLPRDWPSFLLGCLLPLLLTAILFLGPLVQWYLLSWEELFEDTTPIPSRVWKCLTNVYWLRFYIVAPLTEEIVYRGCLCALLHEAHIASPAANALVAMTFGAVVFSLSHFHHFIERSPTGEKLHTLPSLVAQLVITSIFGFYSTFLFLRTGYVAGPFLAHTFCNWMGFPRLDVLGRIQPTLFSSSPTRPTRSGAHPARALSSGYTLMGLYVAGIVGFCLLAGPMTWPALFESPHW
ncbi:putative CAAX prenyl protease 2 [Paratrimastix pyriformis]|uniref:intramembrane prenyl-peptidase Rce1 n=1 Tax=Paratrimastix pyriformis TaxID=342808 RepID=A0ABQ8UR61_9EUKA|nr:putative CAAX prenyl protease 2 [Paratrimastix pyriformis]